MKRMFKVIAIMAFSVIIGFGLTACPEPDGLNGSGFTISGSFAAQNGSGNAVFFASESTARSARTIIAADEIFLEGLLEDGPITFRLQGSYDRGTKIFILSAAGSFLRYSISGNLNNTNDSKAIVQVRDTSGNWTSIEVDVNASSTGTAPSIDGSGTIEDELAGGLPEEMWGIWWGTQPLAFSETDIQYPGNYYYVIDAYTVIPYVNNSGTWGQRNYICYFDGVTKDKEVVTGISIFGYTNNNLINETHPNWWIQAIADYAMISKDGGSAEYNEIIAVINNGNLWADTEWKINLNNWNTKANEVDFIGERWNQLFNYPGSPYFYEQYKKDAYKIVSGELQMGVYHKANTSSQDEVWFGDSANSVKDFTDLRWSNNLFSKSQGVPAKPPTVTVKDSFDAYQLNNFNEWIGSLTSSKNYQIIDLPNEGRNNVIKVSKPNGGDEWAVALWNLSSQEAYKNIMTDYRGKTIMINFGADVKRVGASGSLVWQVNNDIYPVVSFVPNAQENVWYSMSGTWVGIPDEPVWVEDGGYWEDRFFYLTAWENNSPDTDYYINNFWIHIYCPLDSWGGGRYQLDNRFTWTDLNYPDSSRGWVLDKTTREKIKDGTIKCLDINLDLDEIGYGLNSVGIAFNFDGSNDDSKVFHREAFPWYWVDGEKPGKYAVWNGWISKDDLIKPANQRGYGAHFYRNDSYNPPRNIVTLRYDLTSHPNYEAFKNQMSLPGWTILNLNIHEAWKDNNSLPIESVFFREEPWVEVNIDPRKPEDRSFIDRWNKTEDSSAKLNLSFSNALICEINVSGTALETGQRYRARANYAYTGVPGKKYKYEFKAWTNDEPREIHVIYYAGNNIIKNGNTWDGEVFTISGTQATYSFIGEFIPADGSYDLQFQCANQLGTFYISDIIITEVN